MTTETATTELAYLSATDALGRFRDGSLSPVELLEALIERAEQVNPAIDAVAERLFDDARAAAPRSLTTSTS